MPADSDLLFGKIAVSQGFCTQAQVERGLGIQAASPDPIPLGRVLVNEGFLTEDQHSQVLAVQRKNMKAVDPLMRRRRESVLFGKLAVREGLLTEAEANECLREQAREGEKRSLGEIMVAKGCLTAAQVGALLAKQQKKIMSCARCKLSFTVLTISREKTIACPRCKGPLQEGKPTDSTRTDAEIATQVVRAAQAQLPAGSQSGSRVIPPTATKATVVCVICGKEFEGSADSAGRVRCIYCHSAFAPGEARGGPAPDRGV